ncbi:serine hydrolase [Streptomyces kronopolitis]|uniref:Serine hydrolase n=1 Tax=Streptomyces kronopolitis TaxID=1612435 RepID=A0ABQ2JAU1_9ACTN|nr:serine hydrolase domain-containing protein [Streptomyces kronopolitis]GGN43324.1 serine hydrolase [Streptomyces kronopolitis]
MAQVHGTCTEQFTELRSLLQASLERGDDAGASVAVCLDGTMVVDLWGGHLDAGRKSPWQADTLVTTWSVAKTMTALCALVLADHRTIGFDDPVARYWPQFAAAGKGEVLVRHILGHTAGLPDWDQPLSTDDLYDWEKATESLARQPPRWKPGTTSGYHALTQGFLLGEIIRRTTGMSPGAFFASTLAQPLGADFHFSIGEADDHRIAPLLPHTTPPPGPSGAPNCMPPVQLRTLVTPQDTWAEGWRRAEIPAAAGWGNARSIARLQALLACGGALDGHRLFSETTADAALAEESNQTDLVLGSHVRFGRGFGLTTPDLADVLPNPRTCWWDGWGGSVAVTDLDARLSIAYAMNQMRSREHTIADRRALDLIRATYRALPRGKRRYRPASAHPGSEASS